MAKKREYEEMKRGMPEFDSSCGKKKKVASAGQRRRSGVKIRRN